MLSKLFVSFTYSEVVSQSPAKLLHYKITHISGKLTCYIRALPTKKSNWVDFFHATKTEKPLCDSSCMLPAIEVLTVTNYSLHYVSCRNKQVIWMLLYVAF